MIKNFIIAIMLIVVITLLLFLILMPLCAMIGDHRGYAILGLPLAFVITVPVVVFLNRKLKKK